MAVRLPKLCRNPIQPIPTPISPPPPRLLQPAGGNTSGRGGSNLYSSWSSLRRYAVARAVSDNVTSDSKRGSG